MESWYRQIHLCRKRGIRTYICMKKGHQKINIYSREGAKENAVKQKKGHQEIYSYTIYILLKSHHISMWYYMHPTLIPSFLLFTDISMCYYILPTLVPSLILRTDISMWYYIYILL